ncbi:MAG: DUF362 domain-containing protein [Bacteroidales bacterium]|jgi:2-oxoacid:acceptor oxidoreductase delta subunit (pyruvate/2-ketoisovalerate family)|nr:DUF362 domain-containing protein [Bacteroidales bacterium]
MTSKVYFTDLRTKPGRNLLDKLEILVKKAGVEQIDFNGKFTAVKIHFGEPGNLAYIRPNYAARLVRILQSRQAKVFLTDSNTLYTGRRSNAVDHFQSAMENGFNPIAVPCPVIIADGLKSLEYREIPVANGKYCKTAKIGSAIADSDIIVSLTHFKGHEQTGFGGTLKNIGMGSASAGGKLELHSLSKPIVDEANCTSCGQCVKYCSTHAISLNERKKAQIDYDKCIGCGQCVAVCQYDAAQAVQDSSSETVGFKIAEYTQAILNEKAHFHISLIMDVSPLCDCWGHNDAAIVPNIGMAASFDPVALDKACADMVTHAAANTGTRLEVPKDNDLHDVDKFHLLHPNTNWRSGLEHAEKMGLGSMKYELVTV